jgi:hypothetical protein
MMLFDGASMTTEFVSISKNPNCSICA